MKCRILLNKRLLLAHQLIKPIFFQKVKQKALLMPSTITSQYAIFSSEVIYEGSNVTVSREL